MLMIAAAFLCACGSEEKQTTPDEAAAGSHLNQMALKLTPEEAGPIIFAADREKEYRLYAIEPDGSDRQALTSEFAMSPEWSSDGSTLAFVGSLAVHGDADDGHNHGDKEESDDPSGLLSPVHGDIGATSFRLGLLTADRDSTQSREAGEARGEPMYPTVDPESGRIFFQVTPGFTRDGKEGKIRSAIDSVEEGVEGATQELTGRDSFYQPAWSPAGDRLAVIISSCDPRPCSQRLMLYDRNLESREAVTSEGVAGTPGWSSDGDIAFSWNRGPGAVGIWVKEPGGDPRQVTKGKADTSPVFSPDGQSIAFGRNCDIFVVDVDGGKPRNVTDTPRECEVQPAWRPE